MITFALLMQAALELAALFPVAALEQDVGVRVRVSGPLVVGSVPEAILYLRNRSRSSQSFCISNNLLATWSPVAHGGAVSGTSPFMQARRVEQCTYPVTLAAGQELSLRFWVTPALAQPGPHTLSVQAPLLVDGVAAGRGECVAYAYALEDFSVKP